MIPALHRDAEVGDWIADCAASLVGVQKGALGALFCLRSRCCEDAPGAA